MNPLTQVKNIQKITARETDAGVSDEASWHANYKDSAYVFVGGIPYELNEGDVMAIFAQYGEVVDINLARDRGTGKSKGFAFLAYEDQRSTVLAVDNLNGAKVCGRIIRVDHRSNYVRKHEEDDEERQRKREENGVCYAFQRGECTRGDSCKYSHDEQRNANTGWGPEENTKWKHDQFKERPSSEFKKPIDRPIDRDEGKRPRDMDYGRRDDRRKSSRRDEDRRRDDYERRRSRDDDASPRRSSRGDGDDRRDEESSREHRRSSRRDEDDGRSSRREEGRDRRKG